MGELRAVWVRWNAEHHAHHGQAAREEWHLHDEWHLLQIIRHRRGRNGTGSPFSECENQTYVAAVGSGPHGLCRLMFAPDPTWLVEFCAGLPQPRTADPGAVIVVESTKVARDLVSTTNAQLAVAYDF